MTEFNFNSYDNSKQTIIIDGVNVEECRHFNYGEGYNQETEEFVEGACECITAHDSYGELMYYGICKGHNCYYKQLKRKEQELEQYKKSKQSSYETMQREWNEAKNEVKQLKEENKNIVLCYKNNLLVLNHEELVNNKLTNRCLKLEQALQEIKKIAERINNEGIYGYVITDELDKILQKCEVKNEN